MTRIWQGEEITVDVTSEGIPNCFRWRGQTHPVQGVANRWVLNEDWWSEPIQRDYFKLFTTTGLLVEIYHDLRHNTWFLQRVYD